MTGPNDVFTCGDEWFMSVADHYTRTGSYRVEDVFSVLGAPWESFQVSAEPEVSITSSIFSDDGAANTPSTPSTQAPSAPLP